MLDDHSDACFLAVEKDTRWTLRKKGDRRRRVGCFGCQQALREPAHWYTFTENDSGVGVYSQKFSLNKRGNWARADLRQERERDVLRLSCNGKSRGRLPTVPSLLHNNDAPGRALVPEADGDDEGDVVRPRAAAAAAAADPASGDTAGDNCDDGDDGNAATAAPTSAPAREDVVAHIVVVHPVSDVNRHDPLRPSGARHLVSHHYPGFNTWGGERGKSRFKGKGKSKQRRDVASLALH
jgi:hypothetical protein